MIILKAVRSLFHKILRMNGYYSAAEVRDILKKQEKEYHDILMNPEWAEFYRKVNLRKQEHMADIERAILFGTKS